MPGHVLRGRTAGRCSAMTTSSAASSTAMSTTPRGQVPVRQSGLLQARALRRSRVEAGRLRLRVDRGACPGGGQDKRDRQGLEGDEAAGRGRGALAEIDQRGLARHPGQQLDQRTGDRGRADVDRPRWDAGGDPVQPIAPGPHAHVGARRAQGVYRLRRDRHRRPASGSSRRPWRAVYRGPRGDRSAAERPHGRAGRRGGEGRRGSRSCCTRWFRTASAESCSNRLGSARSRPSTCLARCWSGSPGLLGLTPPGEAGAVRGAAGSPLPRNRGGRLCFPPRRRAAFGDLGKAEVVLVGVSRTMKTPTMLYLAYRGWFAANVPLVPELAPPGTC